MTDVNARGLVINIHNEFRTALLNSKYYGWRLDRCQKINRAIEIVIAVGATTGTGIAGFAIKKNGAGAAAWAVISGASVVLATLKPIVDLPKKIEQYRSEEHTS